MCTTQKNGSHLCPFKLKSCNIGFLHLDVLIYVSFLVWTQTLAHVYFFIDESVACCQLLFSVQVFKEELSPSTFCSVFLLGVERASWGKKT